MTSSQCNFWQSKDPVRILPRQPYESDQRLGIRRLYSLRLWVFLLIGLMVMLPHEAHAYCDEGHKEATRWAIQILKNVDETKRLYEEVYRRENFEMLINGAGGDGTSKWPGEDYGFVEGNERSFRHYYDVENKRGVPWYWWYKAWGVKDAWVKEPENRIEIINGQEWKFFDHALDWARDGAGTFGKGTNVRNWCGAVMAYGYTPSSRKEAYYRLGHVAHLVQDMAEPDHSVGIQHWGSSLEIKGILSYILWPLTLGIINKGSGYERIIDDLILAGKLRLLTGSPVGDKQLKLKPEKKLIFEDYFNVMAKESMDTVKDKGYIVPLALDPIWKSPNMDLDDPMVANWFGYLAMRLLSRSAELNAGLFQFFHDIVSPPPYVYSVTIWKVEGPKSEPVYEMWWLDQHKDMKGTHDGHSERKSYFPKYDYKMVTHRYKFSSIPSKQIEPLKAHKKYNIEIVFGPTKDHVETPIRIEPASVEVLLDDKDKPIQGNLEVKMIGSNLKANVWKGSFTPKIEKGNHKKYQLRISAKDVKNHMYNGGIVQGLDLDRNPFTPAHRDACIPSYKWVGYEPGEDKNHQIEVIREIAEVWLAPEEQTIPVGGTAHFNLYVRYKDGDPEGEVIEPDLKKTYTKHGRYLFTRWYKELIAEKRYKPWRAVAKVFVEREIAEVWLVPEEQTIPVGGTAHFDLYVRYKGGDPEGEVIEPDLKKTYTKPGRYRFKKIYKQWEAEAIVIVTESRDECTAQLKKTCEEWRENYKKYEKRYDKTKPPGQQRYIVGRMNNYSYHYNANCPKKCPGLFEELPPMIEIP